MMTLQGILKKDEIKKFYKKDGSVVTKRIVYIENKDSVFPTKVSIDDNELVIGKVGDSISLDVNVYPFYFLDGAIKRANLKFYVAGK